METRRDDYIPALKYNWLTSLYDPVMRWTMRETTFKRRLVDGAGIQPGHRVLDLGCGTGTLTVLVKQLHPAAEVHGLDGDERVLQLARAKAVRSAVDIGLDQGLSFALPYPDQSFDRVLSSLLFHHLTRANKARTLAEAWRVLRPGEELHIADWGRAPNVLMRAAFLLVQMLDGFASTGDNVAGLLPDLIRSAGFSEVRETARFATVFGSVSLYAARKPG